MKRIAVAVFLTLSLVWLAQLPPQHAHGWTHGSSGGGGAYVAKAVHFDGISWLLSAAGVTSDSSLFSFSGWFNTNGNQSANNSWAFFDFGPAANEYTTGMGSFAPDTYIALTTIIGNASGTNTLSATSPQDPALMPINSNWHHFFGYMDANHSAGNKIIKIFYDGIDITFQVSDTNAAFQMAFSSLPLAMPDTTDDFANPQFTGDMADWWIAPGVLQTNITIFRDPVTGKPKNPSGFPPSAVLFSGDHTTFPVNQGTGGAFTLTGTLTDASTHP